MGLIHSVAAEVSTCPIIVLRHQSNMAPSKKGLLERLAQGPVIGDGGFVFELEKRGYVKAGPWTPEAAVEDPEAVRQLHREFLRAGLDAAGLKPYLMCQPLAFYTPDAGKQGFIDLPEFPFGLEPRICTRWDMHKFAREAWELGGRYIGGCCGFEPYHIRALAEELAVEKGGKKPAGSEKHMMWGEGLEMHTKPWVRARARRAYWENMKPASGRPFCPSMSCPDNWGVTKGDAILVQQQEAN